jgi:outer membrane receptor protein involved in Fe transport
MSFKRNKLRDAITFALVVGSAGAFGTAFAQETTTPAGETPSELDTIVVTGTRIQSQTVTESSPVVEIQPEEFQYAGATRVDDLVNQYPQMSPYFDSFANNGATGYPTVSLRQLGPQRTLTLVNGNRLAPGPLEVRDISIIPASLVKRVDILTGGASAVYGSDAIAGVVNFILNTEFEGVSVSAGVSAYQHDNDNNYIQGKMDARGFEYPDGNTGFDGVSQNIDLAIGSSFADGAGHAMAWLTWRKNEALFQGERDYSSCALDAAGRTCGGSGTNAFGNFIVYQGSFGDLVALNPDGTFTAGAFGPPYNYAPINYYQRPDERYTFGSSLKYEINEHFRPYIETMFMHRSSSIQVAESGTFFADLLQLDCSQTGNMCADLGLDPTQPIYAYVGRRNIEGGPRIQKFDTNSYRFVAGVEGAINDSWSYNTSFLYGHTTQDNQGFNDFLSDRIGPALRGCQPGDTFPGCLPYNPFVPGSITPEAAAAITGTSFTSTKTALKSFNAYVTGDLGWAFPWADDENVSVVFGGEWREETYDFTADQDSQEGNYAGAGGPSLPLAGKISVSELFMESALPIYKGDGVLRAFALDLGYRLSDYNLSGHAETYKIGFTSDWGMVRARGGFNHAIRAPGTAELFSGQQIALTGTPDPCAGATPDFTLEQCVRTGIDPSQYGNILESPAGQYNMFTGGNPGLQPESADTWTLGFVITPIDNLQITLDYYKIKLEDQITTIGVQDILRGCGLSDVAFLCDLIHRNPNSGDLWIGNDLVTSGYTINLTNNFGELDFRGIDLGVNYRWEMLGGRFSASLQGTYLLNQKINSLPGVDLDPVASGMQSAEYDCAGLINPNCQSPEWRHIANLRYSRDWYTLNLRWRYFGSLDYNDAGVGVDGNPPLFADKLLCDEDENATCLGDGTLHAQNYVDLSASAFIGKATEITVGVNNIADKEPPLVGVNEALNANAPGGYDQAGRYFFANVTFKW